MEEKTTSRKQAPSNEHGHAINFGLGNTVGDDKGKGKEGKQAKLEVATPWHRSQSKARKPTIPNTEYHPECKNPIYQVARRQAIMNIHNDGEIRKLHSGFWRNEKCGV